MPLCNRPHIIEQRCCCCCCWPGAGGTPGRGRPRRMTAPPAAANAARPACCRAAFCSIWKKTKIYIKSNFREITMSQCCGSGMFIPDPDFYPSRIPNIVSQIQNFERCEKQSFVEHFFVATNFATCKIILCLNCSRKKNYGTFYAKSCQ